MSLKNLSYFIDIKNFPIDEPESAKYKKIVKEAQEALDDLAKSEELGFDSREDYKDFEKQQEEEESSGEEPYWDENLEEYVGGKREKRDNKIFTIEAFGKDEKGQTYSLLIENFEPFFYVRVGDHWTNSTKNKLE